MGYGAGPMKFKFPFRLISMWVVRSTDIVASDPGDSASLFEPAADKVYRHPTFYDLPDELKHMENFESVSPLALPLPRFWFRRSLTA